MSTNNLRALRARGCMMGRNHGVNIIWEQNIAPRTDGNTVWLPDPGMLGTEVAAQLLDGLLDHEIAHTRFTDFEVFSESTKPIQRGLSNILEDCSIEERFAQMYPGSRKALKTTAQAMDQLGKLAYDESAPADSLFTGFLLTNLRTERLNQPISTADSFRDHIELLFGRKFIQDALDVAHEAISGHSTRSSVDGAIKLVELLRQKQEEMQEQQEQEQQEAQQDMQPNAGQEQQQAAGGGEGQGDQPGQSGTGSPGTQQALDALSAILDSMDGGAYGKDLGELLAEALDEEQESSSVPGAGHSYSGAMDDFIRLDDRFKVSDGFLNSAVSRAKSHLLTRLETMLETESATEVHHRSNGLKINSSRLAGLMVGRTDVFEHQIDGIKVDTAVSITVDVSGSTSIAFSDSFSVVHGIAACLDATTQALVAYDVPTEISLFSEGFITVKRFEQTWSKLRNEVQFGHADGTNTPEAIELAATGLLQRQEQRKILCLLTDGDAGDWQKFAGLAGALKAMGVDLRIVMIGGHKQHFDQYKAIAPTGHATTEHELHKAVFDALQGAFVSH